jgi:molybdenum cofactor synthesis domain-containing protein
VSGRTYTACLLVVGDEILSGRTQDRNLGTLARWLNTQGIRLKEARVIPDELETIAAAVNAVRRQFDYVFTTGGIGPTHDDITVDAVAHALGVPVIVHPRARAILEGYYKDQLTDARLRMARTPDGAELIENARTGAPGVRIQNIFMLAGVPSIMQSMLDALEGQLEGGSPMVARAVGAWTAESVVADLLRSTEKAYDGLAIGSYPFWREGRTGANFILRSVDEAMVARAADQLKAGLRQLGLEPVDGEL